MKKITLLGATGSIGVQTLEVIRAHPDKFQLAALSFGENIQKALPIIQEFNPEFVVVKNQTVKDKLLSVNDELIVLTGEAGMVEISRNQESDLLVNAVMGSVGLTATLEAIKAKKQVAIANKETLVTAGHLIMEEAHRQQVDLLPIDSEHSAILQSLNGERIEDIRKIILTASGGSFRDKTRGQLESVTVKDALNHPNWSMGAKITVDSATMMNKGLEVIEAHWLFGIDYSQIEVVLHKESIIHSMVEYKDNSIIAQLGTPDMKVPIQYALTYPTRMEVKGGKPLDFTRLGELHFQEMDLERFPCLKMAYQAGKDGGSATTVLNAANEVAAEKFLKGEISFLTIEELIERALNQHQVIREPDLETILAVDKRTRLEVASYID